MNYKQMGAIALTLIICVPIALGYALSTEETEVTGYETTDQTSISDLLLNSTSPYYATSTSSANNATVFQRIYYPSGGATQTSSFSPNFVSTSSTYSALPITSTVTQDFAFANAVSTTTNWFDANGQGLVVGKSTYVTDTSKIAYSITADTNPAFGVIRVSYTTSYSALHCTHYFEDINGTATIRQAAITELVFYTIQDGDLWTYYLASATGQHVSDLVGQEYIGYAGLFDVSMTATIKARAYSDVSSTPTSWTTTMLTPLYSYTDNGKTYKQAGAADGEWTITRSGSTYTVIHDSDTWTITASDFQLTSATLGASYTTLSSPGTITGYADPAYGWKLPNASNVVHASWWYNYQANNSITMMVDLSGAADNDDLTLLPTNSFDTVISPLLSITTTSGKVSVAAGGTTTDLGTYTKLMITLSADGWTVSGLAAWPSMGSTATILNSISGTADIGDYRYVRISGAAWDDATFRVDSAVIQAGTFPSTKNYVFSVTDLFPTYTRVAMELTSIGVYGDSITLGGDTTFGVVDGKINIFDGTKVHWVPLKGAVITVWDEGDNTICTINGVRLDPIGILPWTIGFDGEWSLTATLYNVEEVTETQTSFAPGVFAFDEQDYVVASMLTAFGTFLVLTATGRASGTKAAFLALICGGSIAVLLTML